MASRGTKGAVGVVLIPTGIFVLWGGLSGYLAAMLAALFAPKQLEAAPNVSSSAAPSLLTKVQSAFPEIGVLP